MTNRNQNVYQSILHTYFHFDNVKFIFLSYAHRLLTI